jgi:two-component sensor histidine kinase
LSVETAWADRSIVREGIAFICQDLRRDRAWLGIAAGAAFFSLAVLLRWSLGGIAGGPLMFLPAILLAGLFGGVAIGLAVSVICMLTAWIWFFPPYGTFILNLRGIAVMVMFVLTAALELYVIRSLKVAMNDLFVARERSNTLFRELQHRVANNLQFVANLLLRERKSLESGGVGAAALDAAQRRLDLMGRVHRRLHDPSAADLPLDQYVEDLCADLIKASDIPDVQLTVKVGPLRLDLESLMSVSLIIAEIITNSLKHSFRDRAKGSISVRLDARGGFYVLTVADDGCGLPVEFEQLKTNGLGQGILESLSSQLGGRLSFERQQGTTVQLVFPVRSHAA